jgi:hypothetical protein
MTMVLSPEKKSSKKSHSGQESQQAPAPQGVVAALVEPTDNVSTEDASIEDASVNSESSGEE